MNKLKIDFSNPDLLVNSPGRINIIGEHTDYNNGFVLPTAIDKIIQFKFKKNNKQNECYVHSQNLNKSFSFTLNNIKQSNDLWQNYILGVIYGIQQKTDKLQGFNCILYSDIPIGSGISSSAALECGLAFGLNELFKLGLSKLEIAKIGQQAEHNFVGTKCGIMDQFASVMSKKNAVILLDCQSLNFEYIPLNIEPYKFLLLNTNVTHNLASSEYNKRRTTCENGVKTIKTKYPNVNSLRDVSIEMLMEFESIIDKNTYSKCKYVISEKTRVLNSVESLKTNNLKIVGKNMYETHRGLQHLYEVSCPELDFLVDFSENYSEIIGARMMGGGFGGCTINLIHKDAITKFTEEITKAYYNKFNIKLTTFEANPCEGTTIQKV